MLINFAVNLKDGCVNIIPSVKYIVQFTLQYTTYIITYTPFANIIGGTCLKGYMENINTLYM